jgi:hypothetical protein
LLGAFSQSSAIFYWNQNQWTFYALPTETLNNRQRSQQHSITLKSLADLCGVFVGFSNISIAVTKAYHANSRVTDNGT